MDQISDRFFYEDGDVEVGNSVCEFCMFNEKDADGKDGKNCLKYPEGKPQSIINSEAVCLHIAVK